MLLLKNLTKCTLLVYMKIKSIIYFGIIYTTFNLNLMKNHFTIFLLFVLTTTYSQQAITFTYDNAGNQTERVVCANCAGRVVKDSIKTMETITENDLIKDDLYKDISYYPNPVKEELYIKWQKDQGSIVTGIEVYSMTGQLMKKTSDLQKVDMTAIEFQSYPQGFYNVVLLSNNGEKKTLKIVKK